MKSWLLVLALFAAGSRLPSTAATPMEYAEAKALADRDEASLPSAESAALRKAQAGLLEAAAASCATPAPDLSPFVVVMALDAEGRVVRTWLQGASPIGICIRKYVAGKILVPPPRVPFHASLELSFSR